MRKLYLSLFIVIALILLSTTVFAVPPAPGVTAPTNANGRPIYTYMDEPRDITQLLADEGGWFGTAKVLVIRMEFADITFPADKDQAFWEDILAGENNPQSMVAYYEHISYNQFSLEFGFSPIAQVSKELAYYGEDAGNNHNINIMEGVAEALDLLAAQNFDFSPYDVDTDGNLDHVIIIQAGPDQAAGAPAWAIWSHRSSFKYPIGSTGYALDGYTIQPVDGDVGTFCHEFGHDLGLPDLYDRDYTSEGVGEWALMAGGSYNGVPVGSSPAEMIAFHRSQLGWLNPTLITEDQANFEIPNLENNAFALKVWTEGKAGNEYFLIENRQPISFDEYLPGHGLLIWHIQEGNAIIQNDEEFNYLAALEQADGKFDLEFSRNRGDEGDPYPGSTTIREFSKNTIPNSRRLDGCDSFVAVKNISDSHEIMTIDVELIPDQIASAPMISGPLGEVNTNMITFSWEPVTGATSYVFELAEDSAFTSMTYSDEILSSDLNLIFDFGDSYFWRVKAKNDSSESQWSSTANFSIASKADILVMIDDGGAFGIEPYYTTALEDIGIHYNVVDVNKLFSLDEIELNTLLNISLLTYDTAIYAGDWGILMDKEFVQNALITAMDNGVNLFITAQDNGWAVSANYISSGLYEDMLHSEYVQDNIEMWDLKGVSSTLFDGLTLTIANGDGANNQSYPDEIDPISPGIPILTYIEADNAQEAAMPIETLTNNKFLKLKQDNIDLLSASSSGTGAVYYDSSQDIGYTGTADYKAVNFAFGFEAINSAADRAEVMKRVLNLFWEDDVTAPVVTEVAAPTYTEGTGLSAEYNINESASITCIVKTVDDISVVTLIDNIGYPAGDIPIIWNGIDDEGNLVSAGEYVLSIQVVDIAGNESEELQAPFSITGTANLLTVGVDSNVLTPNGDSINDEITVSGSVIEDVTVSIEVFDSISNDFVASLYNSDISTGDFEYVWDGSIDDNLVTDGNYLLVVNVANALSVDRFEFELLVDAQFPEFRELFNSMFIAPANPDFYVNLAGNVDVGKTFIRSSEQVNYTIDFYQEDGDQEIIFNTLSGSLNTTLTQIQWDAKDSNEEIVEDGSYNIRITLEDFAGNQVVDDSLTFIVDSTPVTLIDPTMNMNTIILGVTEEDTVSFSFTTEEDLAIAYLTVREYIPEWHWYGATLEILDGDSEPLLAGDHLYNFQWDGENTLPVGDYCFRLRLYDEHTTNKIFLFPFQIIEQQTVNNSGGVYSVDYASVSIPEGAIAEESKIAFYRNLDIWGKDNEFSIGAYAEYLVPTLGTLVIKSNDPDLEFTEPITLTFTYDDFMFDKNFDGMVDENLANNPKLVIYKWDGVKWASMPTTVDEDAQTLMTATKETGKFAVFAEIGSGEDFDVVNGDVKAGFIINPFSPNGDGIKDMTKFAFFLPVSAKVTLKIYDHNGNLAKIIVEDTVFTSGTNWIDWDGKNTAGQILPSGMYIYKYTITHNNQTVEGKGVVGILK